MRERLGAGVGGETWRAQDTASNREVVVKLSKDGNSVLSVSEYIDGQDLSVLRGQDWRRIVPVVAHVAEALAALHARGAVHRDLKTANVILKPDGSVALIDSLDESDGPVLSPYSASPQHYRGEPPTPADDAYAFGVLLYELLSGYPPYFPNVTRERVLNESPAPLNSVQPIPSGLQDLTMQLLAKDPDKRPSDMNKVSAILRGLVDTSSLGEVGGGPEEVGAAPALIIRPIVRPAAGARAGSAGTGGRLRTWLTALAFLALAAIAVGVFVFLPRYVPSPIAPPAQTAAPAAPAEEPAAPAQQIDYMALAEAMDKAEQVRKAYEALHESLEKQDGAKWAPEQFAAARAQAETGRQQFAKREYAAAEQSYKAGLDSLQQVADIVQRRERAARQAKAAEEARKATEAAAERARVAANEFAVAMSEGMRSLAAGKLNEARAALNRAGRIRPGAPEVTDGLAQIAQAEQRQKIAAAQKQAEAFEAGELWAQALAQYEAALKLDPSLQFARTGLERVRPRLELNNQLEQLITDPRRLLSEAVRQQAQRLLAQAQKIAQPGPVLRQQTTRVAEELKQAQTPVRVALESDGATDVIINRVAKLGAFASRDVELLPGNYTVVGTRPGFRDVRHELAVLPGKAPAKLIVRCEEPI